MLTTLISGRRGVLKNVTLDSITFLHSRFEHRPGGYASAQATAVESRDDNGSRPSGSRDMIAAAVHLDQTEHCRVTRCRFTRLGGTALWLGRETRHAAVSQNVIDHVGGNGINVGEDNDRRVGGVVWHRTETPKISTDNQITDNEISFVGRQLPGAVGIWIPLSRRVEVRNNHIHDCPYTGISLGWMWNRNPTPAGGNVIADNHIEFVMQTLSDGAGVYTLGRQPESQIRGNRISDVPLNLGRAESNGIFCDEGTEGFTISQNEIRRTGKSPLRFHRAGNNIVRENRWERPTSETANKAGPAVRYIRTSPDESVVGDNDIVEPQTSTYLIGNSLTWDTVPSGLDGCVRWHVDCGKPLPWIRDHPGRPCVASSRKWPLALRTTRYDAVCVQPHFGSTLDDDFAAIAGFLALQPDADLIIHTGWPKHEDLPTAWPTNRDTKANGSGINPSSRSKQAIRRDAAMTHDPAYVRALIDRVKRDYPSRTVRCTRAAEVLASIRADVDAGRGPIENHADLYRDAIHMTLTEGRFLMHNLMRRALGQPVQRSWEGVDAATKNYLLNKIDAVLSGR